MKYIASCSFGKDSLAMVLMLIERGLPLDEVVFYDTGMEFQAIYDLRDDMLPIRWYGKGLPPERKAHHRLLLPPARTT